MRTKILAGTILGQCPECLAVEVQVDPKRTGYQQSICDFPNLPKKTCYQCVHKAVSKGITTPAV